MKKVNNCSETFLSLFHHPLLEDNRLPSLFDTLDQIELESNNVMTIDDHYDQAYQEMKRIKIKRIESEQIVKRECSRMMEQIEGRQQQQQQQQQQQPPSPQQLANFLPFVSFDSQ